MSGFGRISSTVSDGRHNRVPFGVSTMGRLIKIGCANMKSMSWSSVHFGLLRSSSLYGVPFSRRRSRTPIRIARISCSNLSRVGGVFRYSMMTGSSPLCRIIASVLRDHRSLDCDRWSRSKHSLYCDIATVIVTAFRRAWFCRIASKPFFRRSQPDDPRRFPRRAKHRDRLDRRSNLSPNM